MIKPNLARYGRDCGLSFGKYWEKHKLSIANNRDWNCEGDCGQKPQCFRSCKDKDMRTKVQGTLHDYDRYIRYVADHVGEKPISEITFMDVCGAIGAVRTARNYSASTAAGIASAVRRVFEYAYVHGDADDITDYTRGNSDVGLDILVLLGSNHPGDYIREELRKERDRLANITRSLTIWQQEKLASILWDHIEEDGRYCLIALMLYAGVRPAEGRALRWKDIIPFVDHGDRALINIYRIRDAEGTLQERTKSDNAYRRIPEHIELRAFLAKRRALVLGRQDGLIDELPVCCFANQFARPCRDFEAAALARQVFKQLRLKEQDLYAYQIERLAEQYDKENTDKEQEQHLTLYVLRRNFWTWLQSSTRLNDEQKRLIMGHELDEGINRKDKNDENLLWEICCKMDKCVLSWNLHEDHFTVSLGTQESVSIIDQGLCRIHLTEEMLAVGVDLNISVMTVETGEEIWLKSLSPVRSIGGITPKVQISGVPPQKSDYGINCQAEIWQAHNKPTRPKGDKKDVLGLENTKE